MNKLARHLNISRFESIARSATQLSTFAAGITTKVAPTTMSQTGAPLAPLCDFDANLLHKDLRADIARHISVARDHANVQLFVVPGSDLDDSAAALELAADAEVGSSVVATAGVHPYSSGSAGNAGGEPLGVLRALVSTGKRDGTCKAVGECGLDYSPSFPAAEVQLPWFKAQVQLALENQLPLFLHVRDAEADFRAVLIEAGFPEEGPPPVPSCVHCFTGTTDELRTYVRMGFYIGLTGYAIGAADAAAKALTDGKVAPVGAVDALAELKEWLDIIPADKLVLETDAPYMGFKGCRATESKKKNQKYPNVPAAMKAVCAYVAAAARRPYDDVARETTANTHKFFGM